MSTHPSLRDALGDYLALRRALGFKLASAGRLLGQFVDHLNERGVGIPTIDDALTWATLPVSAPVTGGRSA
jgi:integrase/recombinase XerD